jgi:hypothetical protein
MIELPDSAPATTPQRIWCFVLEESMPRLGRPRRQAGERQMSRFVCFRFEFVLEGFAVQSLLSLDPKKLCHLDFVEVLPSFGF